MANLSTEHSLQRKFLLESPDSRSKSRGLRIRVIANISGWTFRIDDGNYYQPIAVDGGALPSGFTFNQIASELFGLAQAARWIAINRPDAYVVMVNTTPRGVERVRGTRWAA